MARTPTRTRTLLSVGMLDQLASGGTNVLVSVLAGRTLGRSEFGYFGIAMLVYLLTITGLRAVVSEPALVDRSNQGPRPPLAAGLALGALCSTAIVAAALLLGGDVRAPLLVLGLTFTGLVVQDVGRYVAFADSRPDRALLSDVLWAILLLGSIAAVGGLGDLTPSTILLAWGASGCVAGAVAVLVHRVGPIGPSLRWVRSTWELSWRYLASYCLTFGLAYAATIALGAVSGAAAVGSVRGAQLLLSPLTLAFAAAVTTLSVQIVRSSTAGAQLRGRMAKVSALLSVGAAGMTALLLLVPDSVGRIALGDTWEGARDLLLPAGAQAVLIGAYSGARVGLLGLRAAKEMLRLDLLVAPLLAVVPLVGAVLGDEEGFLWALASCHVAIVGVWWAAFHRFTADDRGDPE